MCSEANDMVAIREGEGRFGCIGSDDNFSLVGPWKKKKG